MTIIGPVEASELVDNLLKEITGLRASVNKYKKRAELANTRADQAEERSRAFRDETAKYRTRMREINNRLYDLLERTSDE